MSTEKMHFLLSIHLNVDPRIKLIVKDFINNTEQCLVTYNWDMNEGQACKI